MARDKLTRVLVVTDTDFGDRLMALPEDDPIWIVDSAVNGFAVRRFREQHANSSVTVFRDREVSPEHKLIDELPMIDLHHGQFSADPPYREIQVFGVSLTPGIRSALIGYGFIFFDLTGDGFIARR
jgi:hypothetical protein